MQREALAIRVKMLGPESTAVGVSSVNLGDSLRRAKQYDEALVLARRARAIFSITVARIDPQLEHGPQAADLPLATVTVLEASEGRHP